MRKKTAKDINTERIHTIKQYRNVHVVRCKTYTRNDDNKAGFSYAMKTGYGRGETGEALLGLV